MEWDWQQFTPARTPTSSFLEHNNNNNNVFCQKRDSVASTASMTDGSNAYYGYPQLHQNTYQNHGHAFHMQTPPHTCTSSTKQPPQHSFHFAAQPTSLSWSQPPVMTPAPLSAPAWTAAVDDPFSHWPSQQTSHNPPHMRPAMSRTSSSNSVSFPTPSTATKTAAAASSSSLNPTLLSSSPSKPLMQRNHDQRSSPVRTGGLQRSNTVGALLKPSPNIVANKSASPAFPARSNSVASLPRRSSPLKRTAHGSLSSIAEASRPPVRTSVVLTIDANGTARTETRPIQESPTRSLKEKYPVLWDDSDSDSDSVPNKWPSRESSLAYAKGNQERQSKMVKLDAPSEGPDLVQLPRSNSTASLKPPSKAAYATAAQLRRQSSVKKQHRPPSVHSRRNTLSSLNSSFDNLATMDLGKDDKLVQNDASSALRQVVGSRVSPPAQTIQAQPLPSTVTRPRQISQPPKPQQLQQPQHPQPPPPNVQNYTHTKSQSVSYPIMMTSNAPVFDPRGSFALDVTPMTFAPAPASFTNDMSSMTRCICHIPIDDGRMVQCNLCAMWSHSGCVGLDPSQHAYVCSFCVNPIQYGHPVRSSSMQNFNAWPVPGL